MTRLTADSYQAHLRTESERFRDVVATAPDAPRVPGCPDWDLDDLLWHLGEVQWFWAQVLRRRPAPPQDEPPPRPADRSGLLAFFDEASRDLQDRLDAADPAEQAWSWSPEQSVGFTARRQAHEALIHRLDAEQATGTTTDLPGDLAADGVAELMDVMYGGEPEPWGRFEPSGRHVRIDLCEPAASIRVATGLFLGTHPESGRCYDGPHLVRVDDGPADAVVRGRAADVDAWLWQRRDDTDIEVTGDPTAYGELRAAVAQPLD